MIEDEERHLASGSDPEDWDSEENKAKYLKPLPQMKPGRNAMSKFRETAELELVKQKTGERMANLVELMIQQERILKGESNETGEHGVANTKHEETSSMDKTIDMQGSGRPRSGHVSKTCTIL